MIPLPLHSIKNMNTKSGARRETPARKILMTSVVSHATDLVEHRNG